MSKDLIGVLTWGRNLNYGGALQALALRTAIEKMGLRAELVNYEQNQSDISYGQFLRFPHHNKIPRLVGWVLDAVMRFFVDGYLVASFLRLKRSRSFIAKYSCLSEEYYPDYPSLCRQTKYETIVVGSDQVWNPRFFGAVPDYLMAEMPRRVCKIAYAASVAVPRIGDDIGYFKAALPGYVAVSLRENSCVAELERECGVPVKWVVDPTLLLSAEEWTRLLDLPESKDDGSIMCYWLSDVEEVLPKLFALAESSGRKIRLFSNFESFHTRIDSPASVLRHLKLRIRLLLSRRVRYRKAAGPQQFLAALVASSAVVSDSFHALMFSTVFRKPVRIVVTPERVSMASRIDDFLGRIGMRGVRADAVSFDILSGWTGFPDDAVRRLDDWIAESRAFLEDALSRQSEPAS